MKSRLKFVPFAIVGGMALIAFASPASAKEPMRAGSAMQSARMHSVALHGPTSKWVTGWTDPRGWYHGNGYGYGRGHGHGYGHGHGNGHGNGHPCSPG